MKKSQNKLGIIKKVKHEEKEEFVNRVTSELNEKDFKKRHDLFYNKEKLTSLLLNLKF